MPDKRGRDMSGPWRGRRVMTAGTVARPEELVDPGLLEEVDRHGRKAMARIARNRDLVRRIEGAVAELLTEHDLILGDSREVLRALPDGCAHLILTSPPYWTLKRYPENPSQLGAMEDYDRFLDELDKVWSEAFRLLVPGGRMVIVVGDVCLSRRRFGRHSVAPLHASVQERCRRLGYDNLATVIWHKITNVALESKGVGGRFLGKPYEPNAVIKNDIEFILFQRKPGDYRHPSTCARLLSLLPEELVRDWFHQIWRIGGASAKFHPAPFPAALAERIVRMFSFAGDTVLDPFMGSGTTNVVAARWGRNSIGVEVEERYFDIAVRRFQEDRKCCSTDSSRGIRR